MPVYEIAPHPDFNFKVGDVVLRLPSTHPGGDDSVAASTAVDSVTLVNPSAAPGGAGAAGGSCAGGTEKNDDEDEDGEVRPTSQCLPVAPAPLRLCASDATITSTLLLRSALFHDRTWAHSHGRASARSHDRTRATPRHPPRR